MDESVVKRILDTYEINCEITSSNYRVKTFGSSSEFEKSLDKVLGLDSQPLKMENYDDYLSIAMVLNHAPEYDAT